MNKHILLAVACLAFGTALQASHEPGHKILVNKTREGLAVQGYDTVAYFTDKKPVKGNPAITADYNGATWWFASEANKTLFLADPARYAPQYGGYCSWAVANGYTANIDPEAWRIVDGKLTYHQLDEPGAG